MKRLILLLGLLALGFGFASPASAQQQGCIGVSGAAGPAPQFGVICQQDFLNPTYAATATLSTNVASSPTDVMCLHGFPGKVIRLKGVRVTGTAGTAGNETIYLVKHTILDTGGTTFSTATPYAVDPNFAAPVGTVSVFTANPTINDTAVGYIQAQTAFFPTAATANDAGVHLLFYDDGGTAVGPPVLRTAAQEVCLNLNSTTVPQSTIFVGTMYWTENPQ